MQRLRPAARGRDRAREAGGGGVRARPARADPARPRTRRACSCCSGSATRRTASRVGFHRQRREQARLRVDLRHARGRRPGAAAGAAAHFGSVERRARGHAGGARGRARRAGEDGAVDLRAAAQGRPRHEAQRSWPSCLPAIARVGVAERAGRARRSRGRRWARAASASSRPRTTSSSAGERAESARRRTPARVPIPPGEIGTSVARLCVTCTSSTLRTTGRSRTRRGRTSSRRSAAASRRPARGDLAQVRRAVAPRTAKPWPTRCLNSSTCGRARGSDRARIAATSQQRDRELRVRGDEAEVEARQAAEHADAGQHAERERVRRRSRAPSTRRRSRARAASTPSVVYVLLGTARCDEVEPDRDAARATGRSRRRRRRQVRGVDRRPRHRCFRVRGGERVPPRAARAHRLQQVTTIASAERPELDRGELLEERPGVASRTSPSRAGYSPLGGRSAPSASPMNG